MVSEGLRGSLCGKDFGEVCIDSWVIRVESLVCWRTVLNIITYYNRFFFLIKYNEILLRLLSN